MGDCKVIYEKKKWLLRDSNSFIELLKGKNKRKEDKYKQKM